MIYLVRSSTAAVGVEWIVSDYLLGVDLTRFLNAQGYSSFGESYYSSLEHFCNPVGSGLPAQYTKNSLCTKKSDCCQLHDVS